MSTGNRQQQAFRTRLLRQQQSRNEISFNEFQVLNRFNQISSRNQALRRQPACCIKFVSQVGINRGKVQITRVLKTSSSFASDPF